MKRYIYLLVLLVVAKDSFAQPSEIMINLWADAQPSGSSITLRWNAVPDTGDIFVYRKPASAQNWGQAIAILSTNDTFYTDNNVVKDSAYEYQIIKNRIPQLVNIPPSGYIYAAIERAPKHDRGTFLLLVDSTFSTSCSFEIDRLLKDVNADGWKVLRKDFSRQTKDLVIKNYIVSEYNKDKKLNTVLILGRLAVPYSGNVWPDSHPEHKGAWPADIYYGDINGLWTDNTVNDTFSIRPENDNIPGDGKWDQSEIPSTIELAIGRVDFFDMPFFGKTETALMQNYLNKNHNYKVDSITIIKRGLIDDNLTGAHPLFPQETLGDIGWRNFSVMLGKDSIKQVDLISTLNTQNYQWAFGSGYGTYTSSQGIGSTASFASNNVNSIFVLLFGSYYGNWDTKNNFLRAPLCSNVPALATCWAGRPKWYFHHMAQGETIGFSTLATQNNKYISNSAAITYNPAGYYAGQIHVALMGDPTLRLDYIKPPTFINATRQNNINTITWKPSPDPNVIGYYIYSSNDSLGNYRVISSLVNGNSYQDTGNTDSFFIVKAAKRQANPSGAYINLSLGLRTKVQILADTLVNISHLATEHCYIYPNPAHNIIHIDINDSSNPTLNITLKSTSGIIVRKSDNVATKNYIEIDDLQPGIYYLILTNKLDTSIHKIVKM